MRRWLRPCSTTSPTRRRASPGRAGCALAGRRAERARTAAELRHLGPQPDQVLAMPDEILTLVQDRHSFRELRPARVVTSQGYRCVSGVGAAFPPHFLRLLTLALRSRRSLLLSAGGARWIRAFLTHSTQLLSGVAGKALLL